MDLKLGIKSDPVEYRYTYEWLFDLLDDIDVRYVQLGSFFELYTVDLSYFDDLRKAARERNITIKSCFTSHRELGGFFSGDARLEAAARKNYERYIEAAALLGAEYVGSNPGSVYRDRMETKPEGTARYMEHMKELMHVAREKGLKGLTVEPMSCHAEPPSLPDEIDSIMGGLLEYHRRNSGTTVPVYLCGDTSHGLADEEGTVLYGCLELFEYGIPYMAEFHFKNTDRIFDATFGFSPEERKRGIVDLDEVFAIIRRNEDRWPVREVVGYFETTGPKTGRDYSDPKLRKILTESLTALKQHTELPAPA
ncbi:MAG: sugar phosphate isomerase/epimerase family protein [Spirochaetia bacterium]